jgi:hypothetical protein
MRRNRRPTAILLALALVSTFLLTIPAPSLAQDYSYTVDETTVDVWINPDGSVSLEYWLTFTCDQGAHAIDVVDLGLPTADYSPSSVSATSNGKPFAYIEQSEYVYWGVAIWLGEGTIYPGETGTVHVVVDRVGGMIYEDSDDPEYASTEFIPNWFDSSGVHGTTDRTSRRPTWTTTAGSSTSGTTPRPRRTGSTPSASPTPASTSTRASSRRGPRPGS